MSFEMDGEAEDPFADEEDEPEQEPAEDVDGHSAVENQVTATPGRDREGGSVGGEHDQNQEQGVNGVALDELSVDDAAVPEVIAQAMVADEYSRENPPVPYAVWRERTSVGRGKKTIEYNDDLDALVEQVQAEFKQQYDTDIYVSDIRMCAMAYGLMHPEALFSMFEGWGIPYDR